MPSATIPQERHPEYYFEDASVCFLILGLHQHTLYRLYPGLLSLRSPIFRSLLSLPPSGAPGCVEGSCDDNPIILYGVVRHEFDYLLTFLLGGYAGEEQCEEFLVSVLKLSAFFDLTDGFNYAVARLNCLTPFDSSLKLQLGRQYRVDQWVEPAFQELMARPLSSISRLEACRMGIEYFYILTHTKALIEDNVRAIAYTEPPISHSSTCTTPSECGAIWRDEWWNGVARHLLHPETPSRAEEILTLLEEADIPGVCLPCKMATVSKLKESDALHHEGNLQSIAKLELMELQTDEPIRASLRQIIS